MTYAKNVLCVYGFGLVKKRDSVKFVTLIIWREPANDHDDFYFSVVKIKGINSENRSKLSYPIIFSAKRPQLKSLEVQASTSESSDDPNFCEPKRNTSNEDSNPYYTISLPERLNKLIRMNLVTSDILAF